MPLIWVGTGLRGDGGKKFDSDQTEKIIQRNKQLTEICQVPEVHASSSLQCCIKQQLDIYQAGEKDAIQQQQQVRADKCPSRIDMKSAISRCSPIWSGLPSRP
jgi:hypothetical protein